MTHGRERLSRSARLLWPSAGYVAAALVAGLALVDGPQRRDLVDLAVGLAIAAVAFVILHRPRVDVDAEHLHLRASISDVRIPLAAVERVAVGRFLAVIAGEKRYSSPAVSRTVRSVMATQGHSTRSVGDALARRLRGGQDQSGSAGPSVPDEADIVEERIRQLAEDARDRAGIGLLSDEQLVLAGGVRRTWSRPVLALLAGTLAFLVVAFVC